MLLVLWEEESVTRSEIARRLNFEQPTIVNTLQRMERDGLVTTAPDPANRRRVPIRLSERGRAMEAPLTQEANAVNAGATARLSPAEVDGFVERIRTLRSGVEADIA